MQQDVSALIKSVENLEDYEQSSQALMELVHCDPPTGARLALVILVSARGDVHLRAFAFNMLYRADRQNAFNYMREYASSSEPQVFAAMLDEVADDAGLLTTSEELQGIVRFLSASMKERGRGTSEPAQGRIESFSSTYASFLKC